MTKEEKIKKILADASEQILLIVREDEHALATAASNIEATVDKIMNDSFVAKTLLVDENNIDVVRYGMLDYIPDEDIDSLFKSCFDWCTTGSLNENSEYKRFCHNMALLNGTLYEDELKNNVDIILLKYKQIHVNDTGSSDGEIKTQKV
jgi:hypothetical protein